MEIAIIGAGNVGGALAGAATKAGHTVRLSSKSGERAQAKAKELGAKARAAASNAEAVEGAEVVILAVPGASVVDIASEMGGALDGKVVVDVTNRLGGAPASTIDGTSAAEQIQARVRGARVVKAFNVVLAGNQAEGQTAGVQVDNLIAGDDEAAKATVIELSRAMGMRAIDAGPLTFARALEAMATLNIALNARNKWPWRSAWKLVGPGPS